MSFTCRRCGSEDVQIAMWVEANSQSPVTDMDLQPWCPKCEEHTDLAVSLHTIRKGAWRDIKAFIGSCESWPCDGCGVLVHADDHCGNDKPGTLAEYLCPDCYKPEKE